MPQPEEITAVIRAVVDSRADGTRDLLPLVYDELKQLAAGKLASERAGHTLQATALVHEAYLRLLGAAGENWENRAHFFGAAAEAMRRILVEHARGKQRLKRGGDRQRVDLSRIDQADLERSNELLALDEALSALAEVEPAKAELVNLKFFGGLSTHDAGDILGISPRTAERHWMFARAWLYREMSDDN